MPGSMLMMPPMPPSFSICAYCSDMSLKSKMPFRIFSAILAACAMSIDLAAFSTRLTMSPIPRMRSARRRGWKSSSASIFSPTPSSLIGLPVTARIESAAPPRPSPSTRVSTMPVTPTRSLKFLARLTASWPVSESATEQDFMWLGRVADFGHLGHQRLVDVGAAGRVEQHDVIALQACDALGAARDRDGILARNDWQGLDADLAPEHRQLFLRGRTLNVERGHQDLHLVALGQALGDLGGGRGLARAL